METMESSALDKAIEYISGKPDGVHWLLGYAVRVS
jgi:hypothetical protein